MRSTWVGLFLVALAVFSFFRNSHTKSLTPEEKAETYQVIDKLKSYVQAATSPPVESGSEPSKTTYSHNIEGGMAMVQDKVINVIHNILHTKPGQELLEKILYNPDVNKKDDKKVNLYRNNSLLEINEGSGNEAECGDLVTINYVTRLVNGQELENTFTRNKPITIQLGDNKVIKGVEFAVMGMKEGGLRRLIVPPKFAYKDDKYSGKVITGNEFISIDVELIKLKQQSNITQNNIRVFKKEPLNPTNNDKVAMTLCGNQLHFTYKISTVNEKLIAKSNQPIYVTVGSVNLPSALNKAFYGFISPAQYAIIMPSNLLKQKNSFLPANVKLPDNETIILDIETRR